MNTQIIQKYVEQIPTIGFEQAFLKFANDYLREYDPAQAPLVFSAFIGRTAANGFDIPDNAALIRLESLIPGGKESAAEREAKIQSWVDEIRDAYGVDEITARQILHDEFFGAVEFFNDNAPRIIREANTMSQIEDAIGSVDWEDEGEE